ncbi:Oidioi.mRNA.OKI2018_I69.XSR.g16925.t1.cds [Oikopleura dioica]|uniref:Oidioi.mRNA.OKI2018_I69.XSR.g16925.t1.cds n=1 Tax=Oikopleura dioica TaxID=34765 RepID=A0ABN7SMR4_OIKDI|nr:Oidioi.mRNA.OKI2018_I69.XSR.g16925.t1.cds [Oikopleura dioica]
MLATVSARKEEDWENYKNRFLAKEPMSSTFISAEHWVPYSSFGSPILPTASKLGASTTSTTTTATATSIPSLESKPSFFEEFEIDPEIEFVEGSKEAVSRRLALDLLNSKKISKKLKKRVVRKNLDEVLAEKTVDNHYKCGRLMVVNDISLSKAARVGDCTYTLKKEFSSVHSEDIQLHSLATVSSYVNDEPSGQMISTSFVSVSVQMQQEHCLWYLFMASDQIEVEVHSPEQRVISTTSLEMHPSAST